MRKLVFFTLLFFPLLTHAQYAGSFVSGHVSVKRADASPQNITVLLVGPFTPHDRYDWQNHFTQTDSTGYYSYGKLAAGTYYISAQPAWDHCFNTSAYRDTIEVKSNDTLVHDLYVDELSHDRDWMPDYGTATITAHIVDAKTGLPAHISIDIFRLDQGKYGMEYTTLSQYRDFTDSTGTFTTTKLCHGIYELRYYYYVDGRRDYLAKDSLFLKPDSTVNLQHALNIPVSVRPTSTLPMLSCGLHLGFHPSAGLAFGVGNVLDQYKLTSVWQTAQAGCEFNFSPSHFIIGPKLTYNYSRAVFLFGLIGGGSLTYYTDFTNGNLFFHPQLGVTLQTMFDVYFGGNIPLAHSPINSSVNTFTLTFAIEIMNWKRLDL